MGVIQRQSIKTSIINYIAVGIGAANIWIIYPYALTESELGIIRYLLDTAMLLTPLILLGVPSVSIRFFPIFENKKKGHNGFLLLMLMVSSIGFLLFLLSFFLFKDSIFTSEGEDSYLQNQYIVFLIPITFSMVFRTVFANYITNFRRIAVANAVNNLTKISVPILALLYFFNYISLNIVMWGLTFTTFFMFLILVIYCYQLGQFTLKSNFKFISKSLAKRMGAFAAYGLFGGIGTTLVTKIDTFMIAHLTNLSSVGIYSFPMFIATAIAVPANPIMSISGPIIVKAWQDNNFLEIKSIYQKSSITLLIIGIFLFIGVWSSIEELYMIMPNGEKYISGMYVLFWLGLGKIFDMATGVNNQIIGYSKYYKFNFYSVIILGLLVILGNFLLIPVYGIIGAALASAGAIATFNLAKFLFIWWRFRMQPFGWNTLWVVVIGVVSYILASIIPHISNPFFYILIKSIFISIFYGSLVYYLKLSPDINLIIDNLITKILRKNN